MLGFTRSILFRALCLGIATGFRSQVANGLLALSYDDTPRSAGWRRWPVFRSSWGRKALILWFAGEVIGDKLPVTPSRLQPAQLASRVVFGTLAGAAIGSEGAGAASVVRGAVAGTVGAFAGNVAGYHARKAAVDATGLPDPAVAVVEDIAAVSLASAAIRHR